MSPCYLPCYILESYRYISFKLSGYVEYNPEIEKWKYHTKKCKHPKDNASNSCLGSFLSPAWQSEGWKKLGGYQQTSNHIYAVNIIYHGDFWLWKSIFSSNTHDYLNREIFDLMEESF